LIPKNAGQQLRCPRTAPFPQTGRPAACARRCATSHRVLPPSCPPSVPEIIDRSSPPLQLCSKVDLLAAKVREYVTETGHVAAGTRQVFNQPDADGIANANENDRQRGRMAFCS